MKIALLCNEYPPNPHGGIGTFVQNFAHALDAAGHEVFVFGVRDSAEAYTDGRIKVQMVGGRKFPGMTWLTRRLPFWLFLRDQVRRLGIDIVETTDFMGLVPFGVGCPVVVRLHQTATGLAKYKGAPRRLSNVWFEGMQLRTHGAWIAMSKHALALTCEVFPGVRPARSAVIPPPIEPPPPAAGGDQVADNFVLHAGFVEPSKGVLSVAHAARAFLREDPTLQLVFAGALPPQSGAPVADRIREIVGPDLASRVLFLGWVDRSVVQTLMGKARLFIFPSRLETFGLVAAEAMLQGCPVIASNSGPFPEFIRDEETGLLVSPDDTDALGEAAVRLLRDPALASAMGERARTYIASSFSRDSHLKATLDFYASELELWGKRRKLQPTPA